MYFWKRAGTGCTWMSLLISLGVSFMNFYKDSNNVKHLLILLENKMRYGMQKTLV